VLQQARARKKDGYDVVIGVVETHGRKETEALLEGLEIVPRRRMEYKGQWLEEMDLDEHRPPAADRPGRRVAHTNVEAAAIRNAISMSRSCWAAASTSI
jgi:K+-sensing histidine kinase KdpD